MEVRPCYTFAYIGAKSPMDYTMDKKILSLLIMLLVIGTTGLTALYAPFSPKDEFVSSISRPEITTESLERYFTENLFLKDTLKSLNLTLRRLMGNVEIQNVFITPSGLVKRYTPDSDENIAKKNTEAIINYATQSPSPTGVMILPTASAIYQDRLPLYATQTLSNEKLIIEEINKKYSGFAMAVNVYPSLFKQRSKNIYFNTHNTLTMDGGYIVYTILAQRLGLVPKNMNDFHIQYVTYPFYGDLSSQLGYRHTIDDKIALYNYTTQPSLHIVDHWQRYESKRYSTLYPLHTINQTSPKNAILGGMSPRIDITSHGTSTNQSLLVVGDENMLSVIPFLATHYSTITFVDPKQLTAGELALIDTDSYNQTLFAFSIENYTNTNLWEKLNELIPTVKKIVPEP